MQWDDDSIESPSDASPNGSRKLCLPSPERKAISPLKKHDMNITNFTRRRKIKKWSLEEEELLREAVKEYVFACWKGIYIFSIFSTHKRRKKSFQMHFSIRYLCLDSRETFVGIMTCNKNLH